MKLIIFIAFLYSYNSYCKVKFDSSIEQFYSELQKAKVKNVESAIAILDDKFFNPNQYAVLFQTRSIQPSSLKYPRILLFGKNRELRIGINHNLGQKRNIDILQFRKDKKVWELREISFDNGNLAISKANPSICISCHGNKEILPEFKGRYLQASNIKMKSLQNSKKIDVSYFRSIVKSDSIYSRLKGLESYLQELGL